LACYEVFYTN